MNRGAFSKELKTVHGIPILEIFWCKTMVNVDEIQNPFLANAETHCINFHRRCSSHSYHLC